MLTFLASNTFWSRVIFRLGDPQGAVDPPENVSARPDIEILFGLRPAAVDDEIGNKP